MTPFSPGRTPFVARTFVALLIALAGAGLGARDVVEIRDDFEDRSIIDGSPAPWLKSGYGSHDASTGDLRICGTASGPAITPWAAVDRVLPGNETIRTQFRMESDVTCYGWLMARAHQSTGNGYCGVLSSGGRMSIERNPNDVYLQTGWTALDPVADGLDWVMQLSLRSEVREGHEGLHIEFRVWLEGDDPSDGDAIECWDPAPHPPALCGLGFSIWTQGGSGCATFRDFEASAQDPRPEAEIAASPPEGPAPLEVTLEAVDVSVHEGRAVASYFWEFGDGSSEERSADEPGGGQTVRHTYDASGRYLVRLTVRDDLGIAGDATTDIFVHCPGGSTPSWKIADVGQAQYPGSAWAEGPEGDQEVRLCAGGLRFESHEDSGFLLYRELTGDFCITARVLEIEASPISGQVGLVARATLEPDGPSLGAFVQRAIDGRERLRLACRETSGQASALESGGWGPPAPTRLRLERRGDRFVASYCPEGGPCVQIHRGDLEGFPETLLVGIAACNRESGLGRSAPAVRATLTEVGIAHEGLPMWFRRGDVTGDGLDLSDAVRVLNFLFLGDADPPCLDAADADDSGSLDITDAIFTLGYLFLGGPAPPAPGPDACGPDPTDDPTDDPARDLGCESYPACATAGPGA